MTDTNVNNHFISIDSKKWAQQQCDLKHSCQLTGINRLSGDPTVRKYTRIRYFCLPGESKIQFQNSPPLMQKLKQTIKLKKLHMDVLNKQTSLFLALMANSFKSKKQSLAKLMVISV